MLRLPLMWLVMECLLALACSLVGSVPTLYTKTSRHQATHGPHMVSKPTRCLATQMPSPYMGGSQVELIGSHVVT